VVLNPLFFSFSFFFLVLLCPLFFVPSRWLFIFIS